MTLEEAIDLAESEVQGIISLVNVLYTDQVRVVTPSCRRRADAVDQRSWEVACSVSARQEMVFTNCRRQCSRRPSWTDSTVYHNESMQHSQARMYQPCNNNARSGLISHALKGASRIARGALVGGPCYFQPQCVAPHSPLTAQTTTP